jgi:nicotinamidase-related amidase
VTKRRISAFAGSDLDVILRGLDIDTLVMAGLVTSGVVLSTLVEAVDRDYRTIVLTDGCADADEDLHNILMKRYFPSRGDTTTTAEWVRSLEEPRGTTSS